MRSAGGGGLLFSALAGGANLAVARLLSRGSGGCSPRAGLPATHRAMAPPPPPAVEMAGRGASRSASSAGPGAPPAAPRTLFQRFAQQDLAGWSPIITTRALVLYFCASAVACAALGGPLLAASLSVVEASARYDDAGLFAGLTSSAREAALAAAGGSGVPVTVDVPIPRAMAPPVRGEEWAGWRRRAGDRGVDPIGGGGGGARRSARAAPSPLFSHLATRRPSLFRPPDLRLLRARLVLPKP